MTFVCVRPISAHGLSPSTPDFTGEDVVIRAQVGDVIKRSSFEKCRKEDTNFYFPAHEVLFLPYTSEDMTICLYDADYTHINPLLKGEVLSRDINSDFRAFTFQQGEIGMVAYIGVVSITGLTRLRYLEGRVAELQEYKHRVQDKFSTIKRAVMESEAIFSA